MIRQDNFLRTFDPMIQEKLKAEYARVGIKVHPGFTAIKIEDSGNGIKTLHYKDTNGEATLDADCIVWAIGRSPKTANIGLDKVGVKLNDKGHVVVDEYQNTNVENVYSLGDVCDRGFELTPVAIAAARRLIDRVFGGQKDRHVDYSNIPSVVFAHPEVGSVGLTEPEARTKYGDTLKIYNSGFISMWNSMFEPERRPAARTNSSAKDPTRRWLDSTLSEKARVRFCKDLGWQSRWERQRPTLITA